MYPWSFRLNQLSSTRLEEIIKAERIRVRANTHSYYLQVLRKYFRDNPFRVPEYFSDLEESILIENIVTRVLGPETPNSSDSTSVPVILANNNNNEMASAFIEDLDEEQEARLEGEARALSPRSSGAQGAIPRKERNEFWWSDEFASENNQNSQPKQSNLPNAERSGPQFRVETAHRRRTLVGYRAEPTMPGQVVPIDNTVSREVDLFQLEQSSEGTRGGIPNQNRQEIRANQVSPLRNVRVSRNPSREPENRHTSNQQQNRIPSPRRDRERALSPVRDPQLERESLLERILSNQQQLLANHQQEIHRLVGRNTNVGPAATERFLRAANDKQLMFNGQGKYLKSFLKELDRLQERFQIPERELLRVIIPNLLKNPALRYYEERRVYFDTYERFVTQFKQKYLEEGYETRLLSQVLSRKQGENESADNYLCSVLEMARDCEVDFAEERLVEILRQNLNPRFQRSFHLMGAFTIENFENECRRITASISFERDYKPPSQEVLDEINYGQLGYGASEGRNRRHINTLEISTEKTKEIYCYRCKKPGVKSPQCECRTNLRTHSNFTENSNQFNPRTESHSRGRQETNQQNTARYQNNGSESNSKTPSSYQRNEDRQNFQNTNNYQRTQFNPSNFRNNYQRNQSGDPNARNGERRQARHPDFSNARPHDQSNSRNNSNPDENSYPNQRNGNYQENSSSFRNNRNYQSSQTNGNSSQENQSCDRDDLVLERLDKLTNLMEKLLENPKLKNV